MLRVIICCCFWNWRSAAVARVCPGNNGGNMTCCVRSAHRGKLPGCTLTHEVCGFSLPPVSAASELHLSQDNLGLVHGHIHGSVWSPVTVRVISFWSKNLNQTFGVKTNLKLKHTFVSFLWSEPIKGDLLCSSHCYWCVLILNTAKDSHNEFSV